MLLRTGTRRCEDCKSELPVDVNTQHRVCQPCYNKRLQVMSTEPRRQCETCREESIPISEPYWKTKCRQCHQKKEESDAKEPKRQCESCNNDCIPISSPPWKRVCGPCFKTKRRKCISKNCPKSLSPLSPSYQTYCGTCYLLERKKTHTVCPVCPVSRKDRLTMRKDQKICDQCQNEIEKANSFNQDKKILKK